MTNPMTTRVAQARTLLFVPGNRPDRFEKAVRCGSGRDCARLDTVAGHGSTTGRADQHRRWRNRPRRYPCWSRCTAPCAALPSLGGAAGVSRLVVGHINFMADTGLQCDSDESELVPLRFAVNIATRLNRLAPPVDGVTVQIGDEARLRADVRRALRFGFSGKLCIHPSQVAVVHDAFMPTAEELAWARKVLAADADAGGAAVQVAGRMVDLPVVLQARRTLAFAARA